MTVTAVARPVVDLAPAIAREDTQAASPPQSLLNEATREIVPMVVEALGRRVPIHKLHRVATIDVADRVRFAADTVPPALATSTRIRRVRWVRSSPTTAEVTVILADDCQAVFIALTLRWWRLDSRWVVAAAEFGWPPDTEQRRARVIRSRRAVHETNWAVDDDAALDHQMVTSSRWDGIMARTTFTMTLVHRGDEPVGTIEEAVERATSTHVFGDGWVRTTEPLSGIEFGQELRRVGIDTTVLAAPPHRSEADASCQRARAVI